MNYKIIFGYSSVGGKNFIRDFTISNIDNNEFNFDAFEEFIKYKDYLIDSPNFELTIKEQDFYITESNDVLDLDTNTHICNIYLMNVGDVESDIHLDHHLDHHFRLI